jgi:signal transduction histidine kinase
LDNGIGFQTQNIKEGLGHKNMRFRIENIQGKLDIQSDRGGTLITGGFPLK